MASRAAPPAPYRHLVERAIDFLDEGGAPRSAAEVASRLLGAASPRVRGIVDVLEQALAADSRLVRDGAGNWRLAAWDAGDAPLAAQDFVVVDVETTGGRSERHRVIEVAAVRVGRGAPAGYYESLVNPCRPLPNFVAEFTGITQGMVDAAPAADRVIDELRAFVGDAVLAGHNVGCDLSFLNYEAVWHGRAPFGNAALDTQELALRLLPEVRRPSLERVAQALGLPRPLRHRALADARLAAEVLRTLLARLDPEQVRTLADLQAWLSSKLAARQARVRRVRAVLPAAALAALPELPGVYTFRDAAGQALYVGKAGSLRHRVAQHFTGAGRAIRLDEGLLDRTAAVEHVVVDSELDALLEEGRRIQALAPPYNVQLASRRGCPFVRFEPGAFPRVAAAPAVRGDPAAHFGPYRTTQAARHVVRTLRRVFQLRACRRALPATRQAMRVPCLRLGQQLCPAPCADLVTPAQYARLVALARVFVAAGKEAALAALDTRLAELAPSCAGGPDTVNEADQEARWEVAMLRECRARLARVRNEFRPLDGGLAGGDLVMAYPAARGGLALYFVRDGRLARRLHVPPEQANAAALEALLAGVLSSEAQPAGHDEHQANILLRWIYRHHGRPHLVPAPPGRPPAEIAAAIAEAANTTGR